MVVVMRGEDRKADGMFSYVRLRKTRHRGRRLVEWFFILTAAAYNLIRIPRLLAAG